MIQRIGTVMDINKGFPRYQEQLKINKKEQSKQEGQKSFAETLKELREKKNV